jgi:predicted  nucleic acid-binding Zn-ribbon protein
VEYISAAAAVGGTVAAGLGQNVLFAAAPLSLSVCLNLLSRRQLDQLTRQRTLVDTEEIQQRLTSDIKVLRDDFKALPEVRETIDISELQTALTAVTESVSALEEKALAPVSESGEPQTALMDEMEQLRTHQIELSEVLASVQERLSATPDAEVVGPDVSDEIAALRATVSQLEEGTAESSVPNLEHLRAELQAMLTPVQTQVSALQDRLHNQSEESVAGEVVEMQGHLEGLNTKVDNAFVNLSDELAAVRGAVEGTQGQIEAVKQQLTDEIAGVRSTVDETQARVNGIQDQFAGAPQDGTAQSPEEQQNQIQAALTPIQEHLSAIDGKIDAIDPAAIQGQSEQLQALQGQLHSMGTRIDNVSAQVSTEMENLPNLVEQQVKSKLESAPVSKPDDDKKASKLFELDALLADLES